MSLFLSAMSGSQETLWDPECVSIPVKNPSPPKSHFPGYVYRRSPTPSLLQCLLSSLLLILPLVLTLAFWPVTYLDLAVLGVHLPSNWQPGFEMNKLAGRLISDLNSALRYN